MTANAGVFDHDDNPADLYRQHGNIRTLADAKGVSYGKMYYALIQAGVDLNPHGGNTRGAGITRDMVLRVLLRAQGFSTIAVIAKAVDRGNDIARAL